jgi:hypothetical protein
MLFLNSLTGQCYVLPVVDYVFCGSNLHVTTALQESSNMHYICLGGF